MNLSIYIEDIISNQELVQQIFEDEPGVEILTASLATVGIELARTHRPDLILLDLHLPDMQGPKVFNILRNYPDTRDIPVVALSADAMPQDIDHTLKYGMDAYLTKPIQIPALLSVVNSFLKP